jgi:protein-disulfide isomerase
MNIKRILTWLGFAIIIALIVVGLVVASKKSASTTTEVAIPLPSPVTSADWSRGNQNGPVTIVEYGDFQCPACQAYYPLVEQVFADSSTTVRFVFRHFPLPQHPDAIPAAKAAEAAGDQGKFWQMYALLYSQHTDWDSLSDPTSVFVGYAQKLGLNVSQFSSDMNSAAVAKKISDSVAAGTAAGIDYTPTFFINGFRVENPESYDEFITDIQNAASSTRS